MSDIGYGKPGSLLWHKNWIYSFSTVEALEDYAESVLKEKYRIRSDTPLSYAKAIVYDKFRKELVNGNC